MKHFSTRRFRGGGVYYILNLQNDRIYVGQTASIAARFSEHCYNLARKKHHNKALQKDWNKHGSRAFEFGVLATMDGNFYSSITERYNHHRLVESIFTRAYQSNDPRFGYNIYHVKKNEGTQP
jgi:group I intron endonuclease